MLGGRRVTGRRPPAWRRRAVAHGRRLVVGTSGAIARQAVLPADARPPRRSSMLLAACGVACTAIGALQAAQRGSPPASAPAPAPRQGPLPNASADAKYLVPAALCFLRTSYQLAPCLGRGEGTLPRPSTSGTRRRVTEAGLLSSPPLPIPSYCPGPCHWPAPRDLLRRRRT